MITVDFGMFSDACQCANNCCQEKQRVIDQLMTQLQQLPAARPPRRGACVAHFEIVVNYQRCCVHNVAKGVP